MIKFEVKIWNHWGKVKVCFFFFFFFFFAETTLSFSACKIWYRPRSFLFNSSNASHKGQGAARLSMSLMFYLPADGRSGNPYYSCKGKARPFTEQQKHTETESIP
jgi:hypothetical protein